MSHELVEQLKRHEGLRWKPYKCTAGKTTIGYGRNLDDVGVSEIEAELMLKRDIANAEEDLHRTLPFTRMMDGVRHDVLVNMVFNLGISRFLRFKKFIAFLKRGEYLSASIEMLDSRWAKQVGKRAIELSGQMRDGQ